MKSKISLILFGCLLITSVLLADQMIPLPVEDISSHAKLILQGKVVSKTVQRSPETGIYTSIDLQVDEVWKGRLATNHFTVVYQGGILGDEGVSVTGQVDFEVGEEIVAFLVLSPKGEGITVGLSQGKFHVWKDAATGEKLVHNRFHGLSPSATNAPPGLLSRTPYPIINRLTIADLKQRAVGGVK